MKSPISSLHRSIKFSCLIAAGFAVGNVHAQTYTWQAVSSGTWTTPSSWSPQVLSSPFYPSGEGITADFSKLTMPQSITVTLGANVTAGNLVFGGAYGWTLSGNVLTLDAGAESVPTINVINGSTTIGSNLAGTQGFSKVGAGTLTLDYAGNYSYTGATSLSGGSVILSMDKGVFQNGGARILDSSSALTLGGDSGGVNLGVRANSSGVIQSVAGTKLDFGVSTVSTTYAVLNLGEITPQAGILQVSRDAYDIDFPALGLGVKTSNTNTNGILGAWATFGSDGDWAAVDGNGRIVKYTGLVNNTWAEGNNTNATVSQDYSALTSGLTTNSLRLNGATVLTLPSYTNVISSGGILEGSYATSTTIKGGELTAGPGVSNLIVTNPYGTTIRIESNIVDNGSALGIQTAKGVLALAGTNTFTGALSVFSGTASFVGSQAFSGSGAKLGAGAMLRFDPKGSYSFFTVDSSKYAITGAGNVSVQGGGGAATVNPPKMLFLGAQSYTGNFTISGNAGGTLVIVDEIADGGVSSSLGAGTGAIGISAPAGYTSGLRYIGNRDASTNRALNLTFSGNSSVINIDNSSQDKNLSFTGGLTLAVGGSTSSLQFVGISTGTTTLAAGIYEPTPGTTTTNILGNSRGTTVLAGANSYSGTTTVNGGTLKATHASSTTPFGTGGVILNGGNLAIAPGAGASGDLFFTGASATATTTFTYAGGGILSLDKGSADSLTYSAGNAEPSGSVLVRSGRGTLVLAPTAIDNLGTTENFVVNGTPPAMTNGIVAPSIVGLDNSPGANQSGYFLTYGASGKTGFSAASATDTNFAAANSNSIENLVSGLSALNTDTTVYALSNQGQSLTGSAILTVASGGVILNGGSIGVAELAFGAAEGLIYTSAANATISSNLTGTGGITFFGPGTVVLSGVANSQTGNYSFNGGLVSIASSTALGSSTNSGPNAALHFNGGGLQATSSFALTYLSPTPTPRAVVLNAGGGTFDVTAGNTLTINGGITGSGNLTKSNSGTLILNGNSQYLGNTWVTGGVLRVGNSAGSSTTLYSTTSVLNGGTLGGYGKIYGNLDVYSGGTVKASAGTLSGVGTLTLGLAGSSTFYDGSIYNWTLGSNLADNSTGIAGVDWDSLLVNGGSAATTLTFLSGSKLSLSFLGLDPNSPDVFWMSDHIWTIASTAGESVINDLGLELLNGSFNYGSFSISSSDNSLYLIYTIPEPGALTLLGLSLIPGLGFLRRRVSFGRLIGR